MKKVPANNKLNCFIMNMSNFLIRNIVCAHNAFVRITSAKLHKIIRVATVFYFFITMTVF